MSLQSWEEVLMVMLTVAFDVSQDQPLRKHLVMAGFVSEAGRWGEFDQKWRARLKDDGFAYFHMQPFAQRKKPFQNLTEGGRKNLIRDLLDIIREHAYHKFACVVPSESFSALSVEAQQHFASTAIAAAGKFCAGLVYQWRDENHYQDRNPRFVFEQGDPGKGSLIKAMEDLTGHTPSFEYKKDIPEKNILAFTPLQASDILAYECKKIADKLGKPLAPDFRFRFPYEQLNKIPGEPRLFPLGNVAEADMLMQVDKYFAEHPLGGSVP